MTLTRKLTYIALAAALSGTGCIERHVPREIVDTNPETYAWMPVNNIPGDKTSKKQSVWRSYMNENLLRTRNQWGKYQRLVAEGNINGEIRFLPDVDGDGCVQMGSNLYCGHERSYASLDLESNNRNNNEVAP